MDARISAVSTFKSDIKRQAVDLNEVPIYFDALMDAYDFKDPHLHAVTFSAICYLTRRVLILNESTLQPQVPIVLPLFIDNFAHDPANENASKLAIRTFEDVWLAFAPETEQALRENGLSHSRANVRAASLRLLSQYIEKSAKFSFRKFTPSVTRLLNDSNAEVQECARDLIVQFFSATIPRAKDDLKKEMTKQKIPQSIANDISAAIGLEPRPSSRQVALTPVPNKTAPSPITGKSTSTIDSVKALLDFELEVLEPIDAVSVDSFRKEVERMSECFAGKESETNWRQRETNINKLRKLLRGNIAEYPGDVVWAIKALQDGIVKCICSLRTTLTAQGCFLIKDAMQIYQSYMDPAIEPFLTNLVKVSAGSKKIAVNYAHVTICAMILSTSYSFKYVSHISAVMNDKVAAARALAMVWLNLLFSRHNAHLVTVWQSQGVDTIAESCIEKGLTDSSPVVREASRPAYWSFAQNFPDNARKLLNKLDPVQKKMLLQVPRMNTPPEPSRRSISVTIPSDTALDAEIQARRSVSERVSERISERVSEQVSERLDMSRESQDLDSDVAKLNIQQDLTPDPELQGHNEVEVTPDLVEPAEVVKQGTELLKRAQEDPLVKETLGEVSKLVEATVREANAKKVKSFKADASVAENSEAAPEATSDDATGAIDEAVEEVKEKLDCDPDKLKNRLSTLSEMLSSEDISTLNQGLDCLSYVLRGKSVPEKLSKDLVNVDLPDPDLIGAALQLIFDKVGDEMDTIAPELKDTVAKFVSPDLVAVSLEYIGHAVVIWAAVNFLPAEMVMVVFEVIRPLLDIGNLVDAIFDVVTADSPGESITLICGQILLRLDNVPLTDALKGRVQQVLSLIYRFGDLAEDVSAVISSWIGDDDSSDDDEEKLAKKQSHKDEKVALANTSGSLLPAKPETPEIAVYSDPVIMSHHVSVSYVPASDLNTSKPKLNLHKIASPRRRTNTKWDIGPAQSLPESDEECGKLLELLVSQVDNGTIGKPEFVELALLVSEKQNLPNYHTNVERLERSILKYLEDDKHSENELAAGLLLVRKMLERGQFSTAVERTLVLQCLNRICEREVIAKLHYGAIPETRDRLFELTDLDTHGTILTLVDLYTTGSCRHSRVFALQSLRKLVPQAEQVPPPLGEVVHAALSDDDVYIRKEAYPVLLRIHQKSEKTAELLKARMSSGQRRLYEFYAGTA